VHDRDIGGVILPEHRGAAGGAVLEGDADLAGAVDRVRGGEDVPARVEHEPGAECGRLLLALAVRCWTVVVTCAVMSTVPQRLRRPPARRSPSIAPSGRWAESLALALIG